MTRASSLLLILVLLLTGVGAVPLRAAPVPAEPIAGTAFGVSWARTDLPVSAGAVRRGWLWGPEPISPGLLEPYAEAPGHQRLVQYFDKGRLELTNPDVTPDSLWWATFGLLAEDMIVGRVQVGDASFEPDAPAQINVVGDPDDPQAPTYASFHGLLTGGQHDLGYVVAEQILRDGSVVSNPAYAEKYHVTIAGQSEPDGSGHSVPQPFWDALDALGTVWQDGQYTPGAIYSGWAVTGLPLTEPYWTTVHVGGVSRDVLVQCFERRCLSYTPSNPPGWQVESANVGRHYYEWRYAGRGATPVLAEPAPASWTPPPPPTGVAPLNAIGIDTFFGGFSWNYPADWQIRNGVDAGELAFAPPGEDFSQVDVRYLRGYHGVPSGSPCNWTTMRDAGASFAEWGDCVQRYMEGTGRYADISRDETRGGKTQIIGAQDGPMRRVWAFTYEVTFTGDVVLGTLAFEATPEKFDAYWPLTGAMLRSLTTDHRYDVPLASR